MSTQLTGDQELIEWDWLDTQDSRLHYAILDAERASQLTDWALLVGVDLACGRYVDTAFIPGIFTRMSMPRCPQCCRAIGYPQGVGSPKNDDACRPLVLRRIEA